MFIDVCVVLAGICTIYLIGLVIFRLNGKKEKCMSRTIVLTDEEIDCFNAYVEDLDIAFGNTDWCSIYSKIVGDKISDDALEKMRRYQD